MQHIIEEFQTITANEQVELLRQLFDIAIAQSDDLIDLRAACNGRNRLRLTQRHTMALLLASHGVDMVNIARKMNLRLSDAHMMLNIALGIIGVDTVADAIKKLTA